MHILLTNVHFDFRGKGSSDRNASRDESVETGDKSVETEDESIEAGEKDNNHVIILDLTDVKSTFIRYLLGQARIRDLSKS